MTIHGFGGLVFAVVIAIFLAFQPDLYRTGFLNLFPNSRRKRLGEVLDELGFTLWWWLMGQLVTMASVGIFIGIGLAILGVPLAGTLGLIAAILSFIPSLGPLISVIPAVMLGLTMSPMMAVWVCLLYLGVQLLEANVITPLVQRKAISLPPAFVLGSELLMGIIARRRRPCFCHSARGGRAGIGEHALHSGCSRRARKSAQPRPPPEKLTDQGLNEPVFDCTLSF